jgi:hypothetical protein
LPEGFEEGQIRVVGRDVVLMTDILRKKEVIQPQVPLRLPCYDFTPVTDHSFGSSLPYGLGH